MREILFKAKRKDNGEWVKGYYVKTLEGDYIVIPNREESIWSEGKIIEIDINTLCQYTGLTDKNRNKIWENDIVFVTDDEGRSGQVDTGVGEIDFLEGLWYISGNVQNSLYDINNCFLIEVIGNIFDNTELLGGADNG